MLSYVLSTFLSFCTNKHEKKIILEKFACIDIIVLGGCVSKLLYVDGGANLDEKISRYIE